MLTIEDSSSGDDDSGESESGDDDDDDDVFEGNGTGMPPSRTAASGKRSRKRPRQEGGEGGESEEEGRQMPVSGLCQSRRLGGRGALGVFGARQGGLRSCCLSQLSTPMPYPPKFSFGCMPWCTRRGKGRALRTAPGSSPLNMLCCSRGRVFVGLVVMHFVLVSSWPLWPITCACAPDGSS